MRTLFINLIKAHQYFQFVPYGHKISSVVASSLKICPLKLVLLSISSLVTHLYIVPANTMKAVKKELEKEVGVARHDQNDVAAASMRHVQSQTRP